MRSTIIFIFFINFLWCASFSVQAQSKAKPFKVIAFYTAKNDQAHISFVQEANKWFTDMSKLHYFSYDTTTNWHNLNAAFLGNYQVVVFLDTRPDSLPQRTAFEQYIANGGGWLGFHFAAFALTPSAYPQNWNWYHNTFLGSGSYVSNTWRPTAATLKVEAPNHPTTKNLPAKWKSAPNEWYRWQNDLRTNPNIKILLSIDASSFPVGTGPKPHEIWHSGYYPVAWTNQKYNMVYFNMGHNDIDYEHGTKQELSFTFQNKTQNQLILQSLFWVASQNKRGQKSAK